MKGQKTYAQEVNMSLRRPLLTLVMAVLPAVVDAQVPRLVAAWGKGGSGPGEFNTPVDVAVHDGTVYVLDSRNHRVQRFDEHGNYLGEWGSLGSGEGQFQTPRALDVAPDGTVLVLDPSRIPIVQAFNGTGVFLHGWGLSGTGSQRLDNPWELAIAPNGDVYVADYREAQVKVFSLFGTYRWRWSAGAPSGLAVAPNGDVYASYFGEVAWFGSTGRERGSWGSRGSEDGQFAGTQDITVDVSGNVYVADSSNRRIQVFTSTGAFVTKWGSFGSEDGQFNWPVGIAVDKNGNVYVVDRSRIQKFSTTVSVEQASWGRIKALYAPPSVANSDTAPRTPE